MAMQRMFNGLRASGVTPIIYCPRPEHPVVNDPLLLAGHRVERFKAFVPIIGISDERRRQMISVGGNLMSFDLMSSLRREKNVSIIHAHTLGRIGGIALTAAKKRRIPFVVTIHGGVLDLPQKVKEAFSAPLDSGWEWGKLFGLLLQSHRLFVDAQAIITCNEKEAALLREKHPDKRIVVQRHGVPVELFEKDCRDAARSAFPQIRGRRVLLSLGRVDPIKNQAWLLDQAPAILRKFPDALLVLAGACTDEPYGRLIDQKIVAMGLENKVLLTGGLPPEDPRVIGLLQEASALLLPSLSETFGLVILEAWAAGTVVVCSRTSGASALVHHGENGWLFDLEQPETFHKALATVLSDPPHAELMAAKGRGEVRAHFSISTQAAHLKQVYESVIEERSCAT